MCVFWRLCSRMVSNVAPGSNAPWSRGQLLVESGVVPGFTHASHPLVINISDDRYWLVFSTRDRTSRSHLASIEIEVSEGQIRTVGKAALALSPGRLGTFDGEGVLSCATVALGGKQLLYYSGWNNLNGGVWLCDTGVAVFDTETGAATRLSEGPVMSRGRENPYFAALTSVLLEDDILKAWYNSGLGWFHDSYGRATAKYAIHYAESENGIDWTYFPGQVIPFRDDKEHSFGRPTVDKAETGYRMWFGCRGANGDPRYRLGFAESKDGRSWSRDDSKAGLLPSGVQGKFDSEAVSYPYVFSHGGWEYLLYSGNHYGASGSGYAVRRLG